MDTKRERNENQGSANKRRRFRNTSTGTSPGPSPNRPQLKGPPAASTTHHQQSSAPSISFAPSSSSNNNNVDTTSADTTNGFGFNASNANMAPTFGQAGGGNTHATAAAATTTGSARAAPDNSSGSGFKALGDALANHANNNNNNNSSSGAFLFGPNKPTPSAAMMAANSTPAVPDGSEFTAWGNSPFAGGGNATRFPGGRSQDSDDEKKPAARATTTSSSNNNNNNAAFGSFGLAGNGNGSNSNVNTNGTATTNAETKTTPASKAAFTGLASSTMSEPKQAPFSANTKTPNDASSNRAVARRSTGGKPPLAPPRSAPPSSGHGLRSMPSTSPFSFPSPQQSAPPPTHTPVLPARVGSAAAGAGYSQQSAYDTDASSASGASNSSRGPYMIMSDKMYDAIVDAKKKGERATIQVDTKKLTLNLFDHDPNRPSPMALMRNDKGVLITSFSPPDGCDDEAEKQREMERKLREKTVIPVAELEAENFFATHKVDVRINPQKVKDWFQTESKGHYYIKSDVYDSVFMTDQHRWNLVLETFYGVQSQKQTQQAQERQHQLDETVRLKAQVKSEQENRKQTETNEKEQAARLLKQQSEVNQKLLNQQIENSQKQLKQQREDNQTHSENAKAAEFERHMRLWNSLAGSSGAANPPGWNATAAASAANSNGAPPPPPAAPPSHSLKAPPPGGTATMTSAPAAAAPGANPFLAMNSAAGGSNTAVGANSSGAPPAPPAAGPGAPNPFPGFPPSGSTAAPIAPGGGWHSGAAPNSSGAPQALFPNNLLQQPSLGQFAAAPLAGASASSGQAAHPWAGGGTGLSTAAAGPATGNGSANASDADTQMEVDEN